jgi:hypothetical protein
VGDTAIPVIAWHRFGTDLALKFHVHGWNGMCNLGTEAQPGSSALKVHLVAPRKLRRFHPDGSADRDIDLPVSQPTMPAFAGEDLATLYVTSASDHMSEAAKAREPHAGGLFRLDAGRRGVARSFLVR